MYICGLFSEFTCFAENPFHEEIVKNYTNKTPHMKRKFFRRIITKYQIYLKYGFRNCSSKAQKWRNRMEYFQFPETKEICKIML